MTSEWTDVAASTFPNMYQLLLQLETVDLQACDVLKTKLNEVGTVNFWAKLVPGSQYPASKKLAISVLTICLD